MQFTVEELESVLVYTKEAQESGDYTEWHRFAFLASVICNVNRGKKGKKVKPQDFIGVPPHERRGKKPS